MEITTKQLDRAQSIVSFKYTNQTSTEIAWLNKQAKMIVSEKGDLFWASREDVSDEAYFTNLVKQGLSELTNI